MNIRILFKLIIYKARKVQKRIFRNCSIKKEIINNQRKKRKEKRKNQKEE